MEKIFAKVTSKIRKKIFSILSFSETNSKSKVSWKFLTLIFNSNLLHEMLKILLICLHIRLDSSLPPSPPIGIRGRAYCNTVEAPLNTDIFPNRWKAAPISCTTSSFGRVITPLDCFFGKEKKKKVNEAKKTHLFLSKTRLTYSFH